MKKILLAVVGAGLLATMALIAPAKVTDQVSLVSPVLAQETAAAPAAPAADEGLGAGLIASLALGAVSLVVAGFAWLEARAARTPAKWDDKVVDAVKKIAAGISSGGGGSQAPPTART